MHKGMQELRKLLARRIVDNGGYRSRDGGSALSWDVSIGGTIGPDSPHFIQSCANFFLHEADLWIQHPDWRQRWEKSPESPGWFDALIEEMQDSLRNADTYAMWSPEVARRYGFSYSRLGERVYRHKHQKENVKPRYLKGSESPFEVKWEFHGRGGKHLCLMEFDGLKIPEDTQELAQGVIGDQYNYYSSRWCRRLLGMLDEWDTCFKHESVMQEANYQAGWRFFCNLADEDVEEDGDDGTNRLAA